MQRREFLGALGIGTVASLPLSAADPLLLHVGLNQLANRQNESADSVARDESAWSALQRAFTVDRSLSYLNSGGTCPAPAVVQNAMKRHLDFSNNAPTYSMWRIQDPGVELVRERLAFHFGCLPEEIAITRNASESLQICQRGLDLNAGDEILTTDQDYPRMLQAFQARERREGMTLKQISLPVPAIDDDDVVRRFEQAITPNTKLILMCHVINLTGQILPVRKVVQMARSKGIPVIVDGAHSFAHFPFKLADLDCDYYGTSLHKWLFAPIGTGMLYVRRNKIRDLWPLMAAEEKLDDDIRKFEQIGTHPSANFLGIAEALSFHEGIGVERKAARLRYLTNYWAGRLVTYDKVRLHTSLDPRHSCALACVQIEGVDPAAITNYLFKKRIIVTTIKHQQFQGNRISTNVFTTLNELDRFVQIMEEIIKNGIPS